MRHASTDPVSVQQDTVPWHALAPEEVAVRLGTDLARGLAPQEAVRRARVLGPNVLPERSGPSPVRLLGAQFKSALVGVLLAAFAVSLLLGNAKEAVAIAVVVVLNAALGFVQEYRAERAMAALRKLAVPKARVRRAGRVQELSSAHLVPGDVILLEAGDRVPADARVVEAVGLRTDESALTGESVPVDKGPRAVAPDTPVPDRRSVVYMGTVVTAGRGAAVVVATGSRTELGRVAGLVAATRPEATPLQRRLERLARTLGVFAAAIVLVVAALGFARGEDPARVWLMAVSLAVAAVPEGLPVVLTLALSLGAQRMLKRRALVRKLSAVETLGSVTVICTDKTGTLTENRLTLVELQTPDGPARPADGSTGEVSWAAVAACLCHDAEPDDSGGFVGDPVDVALARGVASWGYRRDRWEQVLPRRAEWPFDGGRKRMTTVHQVLEPGCLPEGFSGGYLVFVKGAPEVVLPRCRWILRAGRCEMLEGAQRRQVDERVEELARRGVRVLALACGVREALPSTEGDAERDLVFLGLAGLVDPLRPEVPEAVRKCRAAGVRVVMVTGDHPATALAVARGAGIVDPGPQRVVTGPELEAMTREQLLEAVRQASVFARVVPEQKLVLVEALQAQGEVVAVTGDGVNDGPALRRAEVGVAMGSGTEVAREASAVVLLDDNFATVVAAVEEGRVVFDNVRKFVRYLFTTNVAELWTVLAASLAGLPFPLYPLQVLWINLVTDGPPALALSVEPPEEDVMRRPPRRPQEPLLTPAQAVQVVWVGLLMGIATLAVGVVFFRRADPAWQTSVFAALTVAQFFNVYAVRSSRPLWRGAASNPALAVSVAVGVALLAAVVYVPALQPYFHTRPLTAGQVLACLVPGVAAAAAVELVELRQARRGAAP